MKKIILPALVAGLFTFTSCKKDETKVTVEPATVEVPASADANTMTTDATTPVAVDGMPTFSNPEVTAFATEYTNFMNEMKDAYVSQDATKIKELAMKQQEWTAKSTEMASKFSQEDAQKWSAYAQKLSMDMQSAMKAK
ncbi:hypothetical protein [Frigoriflavimonas asaccharolytica]|uniref:Uncharacterized protein n=1 Tax=Frigoriflavimonas asaccharolytica TaxID=2735899 RepID=A0A8J8G9R0_9FLAO|nr:hypothetical protein [Frigoriflavimonas asaccharolytica]NRS93245.1 hypothetical protein [Frigoriflavimonas asaccharolytica]